MYSAQNDITVAEALKVHESTEPPISLHAGAAVVYISPKNPAGNAVVALIERVHLQAEDIMLTEDQRSVPYIGKLPRITLMYVRTRSAKEVEDARINNLTTANSKQSTAPVEYVRVTHVPHIFDVESFCMLTDGNVSNVINCPRYGLITKLSAE